LTASSVSELAFLKVIVPVKETAKPRSRIFSANSQSPEKQWITARNWP
jgi:hypothetical protein